MQIIRDDTLVARRKRIGQIASLVGIGIIGGGLVFTWVGPNQDVSPQLLLYVPLATLVVGFILSNIGMYFTNRWGRSPRPDEVLDKSLKGMNRAYRLYHFVLPAPHVLLTPSGPVVLTVNGRAEIIVQDARSYQALIDRIEAIEGIQRGLDQMREGKTLPADKALEGIRKKRGIPSS